MDLFLLKRFTVQKCLPEVPKGLKPIASVEKRCSWNMKNKWKPCGELSTHAYLTAKWKESLRSTRVVFGCTELLVAPTCMPLLSPPPRPNDPLRSAGKHQSPKLHHEQNIFRLISGTDRLRDANSITVSGWHICFQREDQEGSMMDGVSISSAANNLVHTHAACFLQVTPMLFFRIHMMYKVQHTWHSCLLFICPYLMSSADVLSRATTTSAMNILWCFFLPFYANPSCCCAQCLLRKWAHDEYEAETPLCLQQFGVFHIKQTQAAAASASRSCSKLLLTDKLARMPFLNLYS